MLVSTLNKVPIQFLAIYHEIKSVHMWYITEDWFYTVKNILICAWIEKSWRKWELEDSFFEQFSGESDSEQKTQYSPNACLLLCYFFIFFLHVPSNFALFGTSIRQLLVIVFFWNLYQFFKDYFISYIHICL